MDEADVPETADAGAGKPDIFSLNFLSLSLTDANGDPKVCIGNTLRCSEGMLQTNCPTSSLTTPVKF